MDIDNLDLYLRGLRDRRPRSFVVTIKEREQVQGAIRTKLCSRVAGATPERPVVPRPGQGAARQLHDRREDLAGSLGAVRFFAAA
jgi:hypothetical protein